MARKLLFTLLSLVIFLLTPSLVFADTLIKSGYLEGVWQYDMDETEGALATGKNYRVEIISAGDTMFEACDKDEFGDPWPPCIPSINIISGTWGITPNGWYIHGLGGGSFTFAGNDVYEHWGFGNITGEPMTYALYEVSQGQTLPPAVNPIANVTISEGENYTYNVTFTDADSTSWTANVDYGDGTIISGLSLTEKSLALSHIYKDNGVYTLNVSITDDQNLTGSQSATVTVNNVYPEVGSITVDPIGSQLVNTLITASANFTDPGMLDTHFAAWDWGDGNVTGGVINETNGSGSVVGSHTYVSPGVYTVALTVTDKDSGFGTRRYQYITVYDPSAGFVQGKGQISLANFGMSAKYTQGNQTPTGEIEYSYCSAFSSTSLDWLVVNGSTAFLRGTGTINGTGNYNILMGATQDSPDKLRVKITDSSGNVIYDNQPGASDTSYPTEGISSGQIKIH